MITVLLLILGFIMIIKASDILIDSASSLALKYNVPKMLVALTIVSFGTCAPEVAISFNSVINNNGTMAFGNVVGSCIVNIFLIVGLGALINPIKIKEKTIKKEMPILLLITSCFTGLTLFSMFTNKIFSRIEAIILIALFVMFVMYLVELVKESKKSPKLEEEKPMYNSKIVSVILLILSIVLIVLSSNLIVDNATKLAHMLHISDKIITMTVLVIGSSLPELFTTVASAKKQEFEMTIGNIVGTNIFNICIVLGLPVALLGNISILNFDIIDVLVLFLSSLVLFVCSKSEKKISKQEGICMLLIFLVYYIYLFI